MKRRLLLALSCVVLLAALSGPPAIHAAPLSGCFANQTYLPLVRNDTMNISRFGSTWSAAYPFSTLKGADDYQTQRQGSVGQVGGMAGVYDFWGSTANPISAQTVTKKLELYNFRTYTAGTGTIYIDEFIGEHSYWLAHGIGTSFLTDLAVGDTIRFTYGGVQCVYTVARVRSDTSAELAEINLGIFSSDSAVSYQIGKLLNSSDYIGVELSLDALKLATIYAGESKLWALKRDGTTHLWAWAKCNRLRAPEDYATKLHLPVELEFYCREGVWYAETQSTSGTLTQATTSPYVLTSHGLLSANAIFTIRPGGGALTSVVVTNTTNGNTFTWTGTLASGKDLIVDTGAWSVKNDGAGAYSGFTYGAGQSNWLRLNPGANSFTIAVTGTATSWAASIVWYDTFIA